MASQANFAGSGLALEAATLSIDPERLDDFIAAADSAIEVILDRPTAHGAHLIQSIENPNSFVLLVVWDSVASHQEFRDSADFPIYRSKIQDYFAALPAVTHYHWTTGQGAPIV
jgi:quinol monooxygenase YgiN